MPKIVYEYVLAEMMLKPYGNVWQVASGSMWHTKLIISPWPNIIFAALEAGPRVPHVITAPLEAAPPPQQQRDGK